MDHHDVSLMVISDGFEDLAVAISQAALLRQHQVAVIVSRNEEDLQPRPNRPRDSCSFRSEDDLTKPKDRLRAAQLAPFT